MNLHKHSFVPFKINECELSIVQKSLEDSTQAMNQVALMLDRKSSPTSPSAILAGIKNERKMTGDYETTVDQDRQHFVESGD